MDCLVLAPWMAPHQVVPWQEGITLVYLKKAEVVAHYEAYVSSPSVTIQLPAVVRLKKAIARMKSDVKFSRTNVYLRDGYRCQYCGLKRTMKGLNYDHVVPRSRGGRTVWENIVTSCIKCNLKKDCRTPEEAGMALLKHPVRPKTLPLSGGFVVPTHVPPPWTPFLEMLQ